MQTISRVRLTGISRLLWGSRSLFLFIRAGPGVHLRVTGYMVENNKIQRVIMECRMGVDIVLVLKQKCFCLSVGGFSEDLSKLTQIIMCITHLLE